MKKLLCLMVCIFSCLFGSKKHVNWNLISPLDLESDVLDLSFNPQNNNLAIGLEYKIVVYVLSEDKYICLQNGEKIKHRMLAWSLDGKYLASDFWDWSNKAEKRGIYFVNNDELKINNTSSCKKNIIINDDGILFIRGMALNGKSDLFAINFNDKKTWPAPCSYRIIIVDCEGNKKAIFEMKGLVENLTWNPSKDWSDILAFSYDNSIFTMSISDGNPVKFISMPKNISNVSQEILKIDWSHDGKSIAVGLNSKNGTSCLSVFSFGLNKKENALLHKKFEKNKMLLNFCWGPDNAIAASYGDGDIVFYETMSNNINNVLKTGLDYPLRLAWSKDGKFLAVANWGGRQVKLYKDLFYEAQKLNVLDQDKK